MAVGSLEANVSSSPEKLARKYDPLPRVTFLNQSKDFVVDFAFLCIHKPLETAYAVPAYVYFEVTGMPAHKAGLFCILIVVHAALDVLRNQDFLASTFDFI